MTKFKKLLLMMLLVGAMTAIAFAISSNCSSNFALSEGLSINPVSTNTAGIFVLLSTTRFGR